MAHNAIRREGEILSARDGIGLPKLGRQTGGIRARISSQGNAPSAGEIHRARFVEHPARSAQQDGYANSRNGPETSGCQERARTAHACLLPARMSRSIGSLRNLIPVAAAIALQTAGGPAVVPVSPIPPGDSSFRIR